ncbi:MAG: hypothetical protein ACAH89_07915 [Rariglobus sp.]|nr:hypothetical protein [Rariglobus sp.]
MSDPTFAECFCVKNNLTSDEYAREVFNRVVYRRVLWVKWLLPILSHNHFAADFDLIYGVERLKRMREFPSEAERFNEHPANHGWLRRSMLMRASTTRLRALIRETLPHLSGNVRADESVERGTETAAPF